MLLDIICSVCTCVLVTASLVIGYILGICLAITCTPVMCCCLVVYVQCGDAIGFVSVQAFQDGRQSGS